jgi:hypothetical protein
MASMEHPEATGKLSALVGRHEEFAEAKKHTDEAHAKCLTARRALEQHWEEDRRRAPESSVRISPHARFDTPAPPAIPAFSAVGTLYIGGQVTE